MGRTTIQGDNIRDDSVTGADVKEETLVDSKIPFTESGWTAANVHAAILEAATGGDPRPKDLVVSTETMTIGINKHHVIMNCMTVEGTILIDGTLGVI